MHEMGRKRAAVSALLLALVTIAVAEAALGVLLVVFCYILKIDLSLDLGTFGAMYSPGSYSGPVVELYGPAAVAAFLFTAAFGLATAMWTFRRWRPAT
jgi:hypothetical protein